MISLLLMSLAAGTPGGPTSLVVVDRPEPVVADAAPIRLWLNNSRQFREGEKARVQVETRDDGYLIVFNYDTEGHLRVLFPIDPGDDNFVRGGRRYEIRGRGDRETFIVGRDGDGMVYAAVSADPFRFDDLDVGGNWDYTRVDIPNNADDPEAEVSDLLQRMSSDRGFDYDVLSYRVYGIRDRYVTSTGGWWYPRPYGYWDDSYCDPYYRPSLFGCRYYPTHGWYLGYSPYRYGYYGYRNWWNDPWYRGGNRYYGNRNYPVVTGRPRSYTIVRRGNPNNASPRWGGSYGGSVGGGSRPSIDYRPRGGRPSGDDRVGGGARPSSPSGNVRPANPSSGDRPRARRSPPSQDTRPMIERERGERGSVDFGRDRPSVNPDSPNRAEPPARRSGGDDEPRYSRPRDDGPRAERSRSEPRYEPRAERAPEPRAERSRPEPRSEPRAERSRPEPRSEPRAERSRPEPRAEPRQAPPRSEPSRPRSSERPRGNRP